jgi:hypothetical protein
VKVLVLLLPITLVPSTTVKCVESKLVIVMICAFAPIEKHKDITIANHTTFIERMLDAVFEINCFVFCEKLFVIFIRKILLKFMEN